MFSPAHSASAYTPDPAFYAYDSKTPFPSTETPLKVEKGIQISTVTFPSPVVTPFAINNTVTAYLFLPTGPGPHPAMLVEHERLPTQLGDEFRLCEGIARAQIAALLIVQPYSYVRRPRPSVAESELLSANVPQTIAGIRQAVLDGRRALDWLSARPDIDPNRLGISGISLGAVFAPLIAGVDRRIKVLMTLDGGADVADILWDSPFLHGLHPDLVKQGWYYHKLKAAMAPVEPGNWLAGFGAQNALLFNGRYDVFILPKQAKHLSQALGGSHIVWTNTGHYGLALSETEAEDVGARWLRSRFFADAPPYAPPDTLKSKTIKLGFLIGGQEGFSPDIAYQIINFDRQSRYSIDGQVTLHGLSLAPSVRLDDTDSIGLELPLFHGKIKPRPFFLLHFVL